MERFSGQHLGKRPHIAVLFADKLGGFVVATPLLRGLKQKYQGCTIDYFGGERTAELEAACPYIDSRFSIYGPPDPLRRAVDYVRARESTHGPYDLAINLDFHPINAALTSLLRPRCVVGRCYTPDTRRELPFLDDPIDRLHEEFWSSPDLLVRYAGVLSSTYIGEIYCRLARVETDYQRTEVPIASPPLPVPDVLIATGATRTAKLWPQQAWADLVRRLAARGLGVGLLGGAPAAQRKLYGSADADDYLLANTPLVDLRGKLTLPQVAGALHQATACITVDNGIMHLAYSVGTPTVALFGASPWRVWAPKLPHLAVLLTPAECSLCEENRFQNDGCLREQHVCMLSITPEAVLARLDRLLESLGRTSVVPAGAAGELAA